MDGNTSPLTGSPVTAAATSSRAPRQSGTATGSETEEDSESESESSSSSKVLRDFRKQWHVELKKQDKGSSSTASNKGAKVSTPVNKNRCKELDQAEGSNLDTDKEEEAKRLFLMGVGLERQGDLYDAVRFYRRSMQLVPDIEYRVNQNETPENELNSNDSDDDSDVELTVETADNFEAYADEDEKDLSKKFIKVIEANGWHFFQKLRPDYKAHFGDLPVEVLTYILRWVVSDELDLRALDILSSVSRGFYCLSRDEEIWKIACERVWESTDCMGEYSTYREMFLSRPRVRFDGVYISKVAYVRPGEHSFQDQSYRPWHMVEYYRYLRFFPDGHLHFLTTSDPPSATTVSGFRERAPKNPSTLEGRYKLYGANLVSAVVSKPSVNYNRFGKSKPKTTASTTSFHMDFEIQELRRKPNWVLRWTYYSVFISPSSRSEMNRNRQNNNSNDNVGGAMTTTFDLSQNKFPPLYFSRVKSYTTRSENILK